MTKPTHIVTASKEIIQNQEAAQINQNDVRFNTFRRRLDERRRLGLYRSLIPFHASSHSRGALRASKYWISLCSNDYLGLTQHPHVRRGALRALEEAGTGAGSSRLISGELPCHARLEDALADFFGTESALLFPSGYQANLGILTALTQDTTQIYSDALNHASIIDGCRLSRASIQVFPHNDLHALERLFDSSEHMARSASQGVTSSIVITEGLFSMEGDRAPIVELKGLCSNKGALLIVDDAHAIGAIGHRGEGLSHVGREEGADVLVGTLGKAFGAAGAFVAGPKIVREMLINFARTFIFTTALHPGAVGAALAALEVIKKDPEPRARLRANAQRLRDGFRQLGFRIGHSVDHIIPILIGDDQGAMDLAERLMAEGIFVRGVRPPTVPVGTSRLRITASALHSNDMLDRVLETFEKIISGKA